MGRGDPSPGCFWGLEFFQLDFQLLDLGRDAFRGSAKLHAPQFGDLEFQFFYFRL